MDTKALRQKILDLAIRGKLVPQDPNDEPASVLLERIRDEKERLIKDGKIKRPKKNATSDTPQYQQELPKGWMTTTIEEISVVERGGNFAKKDFVDSGYPCIHYGQIHTKFGDTTYDVISYLDRKLAGKQRLAHPKDIIMAVTSENMQDVCKCTAWMGNYDVAVGGHTAIIRHWVSPLFLVYYFRSHFFNEQKVEYAHGSKVIEMSPLQMASFLIPLPPLAEQERIVAEIQRLFSLIDMVDNERKGISELIKNTKSKILSLAILGKLVEQCSDDEPAHETLKRINPEWQPCDTSHYQNIPKGWTVTDIKSICTMICDGDWIEKQDQSEIGIRLIQTGNIGCGEYMDKPTCAKFISIETFKRLNCTEIFEGDCLISRLPNPVGRACILPNLDVRAITAVDCSILRFNNAILRDYFIFFSQSPQYLSDVEDSLAGSTRLRISRKNLEYIAIPIPPIVEQQRIVDKIKEIFSQLDEIVDKLS